MVPRSQRATALSSHIPQVNRHHASEELRKALHDLRSIASAKETEGAFSSLSCSARLSPDRHQRVRVQCSQLGSPSRSLGELSTTQRTEDPQRFLHSPQKQLHSSYASPLTSS